MKAFTSASQVTLTDALPAGVSFDAASNTFVLDDLDPAFQSLGAGQTADVAFSFALDDGTIATATLTATGVNDAPVVSGPVTGLSLDDGGIVGGYGLAALLGNARDPDATDKLTVLADPEHPLPEGVSIHETPEIFIPGSFVPGFTIPAHPFTGGGWKGYMVPAQVVPDQIIPDRTIPATFEIDLDPSNDAYKSLADGEHVDVTVHYLISDGTVSVPASAIITVNGVNNAPAVSEIGRAHV